MFTIYILDNDKVVKKPPKKGVIQHRTLVH